MSNDLGADSLHLNPPTQALGRLTQGTLLIACFLGVAMGYSSTYFYSSGLFILPIAKEFGLTRGQASLGPLLSSLGAAAVVPLFGRLLDRVGAIPLAILSLIGLASGFVALATFSRGLTSYLACSLLLAVLGAGSTALPYSRLIVQGFSKRRGLALGVMLTGTGSGAMLIPLIVLPLIQRGGWRTAYDVLAVSVFGSSLLVAMLLLAIRPSLSKAGSDASHPEDRPIPARAIWTSQRFWLIGTFLFMVATSVVSVVVHFVPLLTDAGISGSRAAALASAIGIATIVGRLGIGYLLDRFATESLALLLVGVAVFGVVLLAFGAGAAALPAALLIGATLGAEIDLATFLTARHFDRRSYGTAYGGLFSLFLVGGALGPAATGYLYDLTGGYRMPLLATVVALLIAAAAAYRLRALRPT